MRVSSSASGGQVGFGSSLPSALDGLLLLCVCLAGVKLMTGIEQVSDLALFDETLYLRSGLQLPELGLPDPQWGPLYSLWYYGLSCIESDPLRLHGLNQQVLFISTAIALYLYLRTLTIQPILSLLTTFLYLYSSIIIIHPRPTHLALLVLLITLIVIHRWRSPLQFLAGLGVGFLVMAFIRPEYALSWILVWLLILITVPWQWKLRIRFSLAEGIALLGLVGLSIGLMTWLGNPLAGGRSWFAFSQHFGLNWTAWENGEFNPWDNHVEIVPAIFGDADRLSEAFLTAPGMFLRHLAANLNRYSNESIGILLASFEQYGFSPVVSHKIVFLEIVGLGWGLSRLVRYRTQIRQRIRQVGNRPVLSVLCPLLIVVGTVLPASLLIYPRGHYLIVQSVLGLGAIALLFSYTLEPIQARERRSPFQEKWVFIALSLLLIFITPNLSAGWCVAPGWCMVPRAEGTISRPGWQTVQFLRQLQIQQTVNFLDADGGHSVYLGSNYSWVIPWDKWRDEPAQQFLQRRDISLILVTPTLIGHPHFRRDPWFQTLLQDSKSMGWVEFPIPETEFKLLIDSKVDFVTLSTEKNL